MAPGVLYVDANPVRRERVAGQLQRAGEWTLRAVGEPTEAVETADRTSPDCLVTVHRLAGWTGVELAAAVRRVVELPVVVAAPPTEPAAAKLSATADAFVRRSPDETGVDRLADAIEGVVEDPSPAAALPAEGVEETATDGSGVAAERSSEPVEPPASPSEEASREPGDASEVTRGGRVVERHEPAGPTADAGPSTRQITSLESLIETATTASEREPIYERAVETLRATVGADRATVYERREHRFEPVAGCQSPAPERIVPEVADDGTPRVTTAADETVGRDGASLAVPVEDVVLRAGTDDPDGVGEDALAAGRLIGAVVSAGFRRLDRARRLERRERQLSRRNDRLQRFAELVSNDLRSPLEVARGNVELGMVQDDDSRLEAAIDAMDRADELIEDLVTFAETGGHVTNEETVVVPAVAREAWTEAFEADATLLVDTTRRVEADADRLEELFGNVFENAIEHGGAGDRLTIRVFDTPTGVAVADDGTGLPAELDGDPFEPGVSTAEEASGYGLSVVREIASAHGWTVTAEESDPGGLRVELCVDPGGQ